MTTMTLQALHILLKDDTYASSFQSMGHYRGALLRHFDNLNAGLSAGDISQSTPTSVSKQLAEQSGTAAAANAGDVPAQIIADANRYQKLKAHCFNRTVAGFDGPVLTWNLTFPACQDDDGNLDAAVDQVRDYHGGKPFYPDRTPAADAGVQAPAGYVLMPDRLTAENGAKGALSGDFHEYRDIECPECLGDGDDSYGEDCPECEGTGKVQERVTVEWDTIKRIYAKAVEVCAHSAVAKGADGQGGAA